MSQGPARTRDPMATKPRGMLGFENISDERRAGAGSRSLERWEMVAVVKSASSVPVFMSLPAYLDIYRNDRVSLDTSLNARVSLDILP